MQAQAASSAAVQGGFPTRAATIGLAFAAILGFGIYATTREFNLGAYWFIGVAFGVILQRSRLCFAGAFRDLIMSGDARLLRAIVVGLMVATVGFGLLMARFVPDPSFNVLPPGAHIQPVGYATVVGGLLFGIGMVLAGGCATGTLWRMGEGYLNSWVAMVGILAGLWAASKTWAFWWDNDISKRDATWLPTNLGMPAAILLTLGALAAIYIALLWWESRSPSLPVPAPKPAPPALTVRDHLERTYSAVFSGKGWSYMTGAVALAVLSIAAYNLQSPLGVTGGLALWGDNIAKSVNAGGLPLKGSDLLAGCTSAADADWLTVRTMTMSGLVLGAFSASVLSNEFRIRYSRQWARYPQLLIGGGLMGYASVIAVGCTVGAFFSSIPSLALSGWLFAIALFGGAFLGVQLIRRLP